MERYSHEGYLIKVVVMALAGEVTRELSPILSWSNNNYDLKLAEKGKGKGVACSGSAVALREATSLDTLPFARPAGAQKILFTPEVRSRVHNSTWAYFFKETGAKRFQQYSCCARFSKTPSNEVEGNHNFKPANVLFYCWLIEERGLHWAFII